MSSIMRQDEEDPNGKNKKERTSSKFTRIIGIALLTFLGLIFLISISSNDKKSVNTNAKLRSASRKEPEVPLSTTETVINEISKVATNIQERTQDGFNNVLSYFSNAKMEVEEAEREAVETTEKELEEDIKGVEFNLKKAIEQLLLKNKGYSPEVVQDIEDEFSKKLKSTINEYIEGEGKNIVIEAEKNMDEVFEADVEDKKENTAIESDVEDVKDYLVEETREEIANAGRDISENIREIAEEIEKEVLNDKLHISATTEEIENAEIDAVVDTTLKDMEKVEKVELTKMENDVTDKISDMSKDVKKIVQDFLREKKGLTSTDVDKVGEEIASRLRNEAGKELKTKSLDVEDELQETLETELQDIVDQDKYIIERAKQLGLKASTNENKKEVDLIEDDIKTTRSSFDKYMNDVTETIAKELKDSIQGLLEKIESDVFEKQGVKVSETELKDLLTKEKTVTNKENSVRRRH